MLGLGQCARVMYLYDQVFKLLRVLRQLAFSPLAVGLRVIQIKWAWRSGDRRIRHDISKSEPEWLGLIEKPINCFTNSFDNLRYFQFHDLIDDPWLIAFFHGFPNMIA